MAYQKSERKIGMENMNQYLMQQGYLPMSSVYEGGCLSIEQETLEKNPEKYIMTECLDACKILWSKNIFTYMTSDYNDDSVYIEIKIEDLDEQNQDVITNLKKPYFKRNGKENTVMIGVCGIGASARDKMTALAKKFSMQDVPEHRLYISLEDALVLCGCCRLVKNPNYIPEYEIEEKRNSMTAGEFLDYRLKYEHSDASKRKICVFDPKKVIEKQEKYLQDNQFIVDLLQNKIFRSPFYYHKHLDYGQERARRVAIAMSEKFKLEK